MIVMINSDYDACNENDDYEDDDDDCDDCDDYDDDLSPQQLPKCCPLLRRQRALLHSLDRTGCRSPAHRDHHDDNDDDDDNHYGGGKPNFV